MNIQQTQDIAPQNVTHYYVVNLGTLGGSAGAGNSINNAGWASGLSKPGAGTNLHATLWIGGHAVDLGTLGGPNSGVGWPVKNTRGELVGISDLAQTDPLNEHFCGFGSPNLCAGFEWKNYTLTPLPTLGGNNSFAAGANDSGNIAGFAETATHDAACGAPQVLDYYATIWNANGRPRELAPENGDAISQAVSINNNGAAAGASGDCGPPNNNGFGTNHALKWRPDGTPVDLGTLGGTLSNIGTAVNDNGDVIGQSGLPGNTAYHAFFWRHGAMTDLGTLPGDLTSEALGLNIRNQVTGYSCDVNFNCRGFISQHGTMTDLNLLVSNSQLYIVYAGDINDRGWIVGQAVDMSNGTAPAVLLIPAQGAFTPSMRIASKIALPESIRLQMRNN
ncbi:MAG: hypothetical protein ABI182_03415, partial [Candidatus Baltobacteraceae bacterium]